MIWGEGQGQNVNRHCPKHTGPGVLSSSSSLSPPASMATGTLDKENGENDGGQLCISDCMFTSDELLTASRATHIPVISELPHDG